MGQPERVLVALAALGCTAAAIAAETVTYTYDARGRLIRVVSNSSAGNNGTTNYVYDKADNRTNRTVTGAPK